MHGTRYDRQHGRLVRVTDRAIEETVFLNYTIRNAGIHELTFLLPASMAGARISSPASASLRSVNARSESRPMFDGAPTCSECGMLMTPNGACYKCENCGSTSGCS